MTTVTSPSSTGAAKSRESELDAMKENFGVVPAIVTSLDDPKKQGRIKLKFPKLSSSLESAWAPVAAPLAGKQRGAFFMPERGDEVLVAFEDGSFNSPYIIGFLWNGVDMPPETDSQNRVIMTPGGHTLRFEDGNEKKIVLKSSSGQTITLDDTENSITLEGGGRILKMSNGVVQIS
jgi:uncharacterized protein involved in type VI secretion and phage assembly